jgi:hypothetical protein
MVLVFTTFQGLSKLHSMTAIGNGIIYTSSLAQLPPRVPHLRHPEDSLHLRVERMQQKTASPRMIPKQMTGPSSQN